MYSLTTPESGDARLARRSTKAKLLGAILLLGTAMAAAPVLADTKAGVDAWEAGDFDGAVMQWRVAATAGDADAAFNLGQAYKVGRGVPQDLDQALSWYKQAMDAGHVRASDYYGLLLYQVGRRTEAMPLVRQSASRGEPRAQYVLGAELFNGTLIEKDWVRAYAMMTRASSQGLEPANRVLAEMDEHIPLGERQQGILLANQIEQEEASNRVVQMGNWDLRPVDQAGGTSNTIADNAPTVRPSGSSIEAVDLPPSRASVPAPTLANASAPVAAQPPVAPAQPQPAASVAAPVAAAKPVPAAAPSPKPTRSDGLPAGYVPSVEPSRSAQVAPKPAKAAAPAKPTPVAPAPVAAKGDWRVQMGAFSAMDSAQRAWRQYEGKISGLSVHQPFLVKTDRLVKLQYGPFETKAAAESSCRTVQRAGGACFTLKKD